MKGVKPVITHDDWTKALADIGVPAIDTHADALTTAQLAVLWKCSISEAQRRTKQLITIGKAQRLQKLVPSQFGGWRPVPAYVLVQPAGSKKAASRD